MYNKLSRCFIQINDCFGFRLLYRYFDNNFYRISFAIIKRWYMKVFDIDIFRTKIFYYLIWIFDIYVTTEYTYIHIINNLGTFYFILPHSCLISPQFSDTISFNATLPIIFSTSIPNSFIKQNLIYYFKMYDSINESFWFILSIFYSFKIIYKNI